MAVEMLYQETSSTFEVNNEPQNQQTLIVQIDRLTILLERARGRNRKHLKSDQTSDRFSSVIYLVVVSPAIFEV